MRLSLQNVAGVNAPLRGLLESRNQSTNRSKRMAERRVAIAATDWTGELPRRGATLV